MKNVRLTVLAGVNGAGKTTLRQRQAQLFAGDVIIDADDYLRHAHGNWRRGNDRMTAVMAARRAVGEQLAAHQAVTWETPLGGTARTALRLVAQAHKYKMTVRLIGVLVPDATTALQRVTARFQQGGFGAARSTLRPGLPGKLLTSKQSSRWRMKSCYTLTRTGYG